jgi:hypothetical protein
MPLPDRPPKTNVWNVVRPTHDPRNEALPEIVVFVPGPDGEPLVFTPPPTPSEVLQHMADQLNDRLEKVKDLHASPGQRLGATGDRPERRGAHEEVLTPLLIDPAVSSRTAASADFFDPPIDRMDIDADSIRIDTQGLSWPCVVQTGLLTRRSGTLALYPSPSANITVLQLIPDRPRAVRSRAFVRRGVRALQDLGQRLDERTTPRHARIGPSKRGLTAVPLHADISKHEYCFPLLEGTR